MTIARKPLHDHAKGTDQEADSAPAPFFSVIIPLYNKRPYIRRAVDSVLVQSFTDFELIVVDDGSTDGSHEALADIDDPRYRLVRQANQGEGPARNAGMAVATGQWIAFLDGDDMWLAHHLTELRYVITEHPDAGLVSTRIREARDGAFDGLDEATTKGRTRRIDYFMEASRKVGIVHSSSGAISRYTYELVGGFANYRAGADLHYWARAALHCPVGTSDRITAIYFRNTGGVMEQIAKEHKRFATHVTQLSEISPSVRLLCELAEREPARWQDPGIRAYVNSRIYSAVKGGLYQGDLVAARHYAKLHLKPLPLKWLTVRLFLYLPDAAINTLLTLYRRTLKNR